MYELEYEVEGAVEEAVTFETLEAALTEFGKWVNDTIEEAQGGRDMLPGSISVKEVKYLVSVDF